MDLSEALQLLAGEVCLQVGPDTLPKCTRLSLLPISEIGDKELCTWLCKDTHFFTLFKSAENNTMVYSHTNEILYHAAAPVQLAPECPKDVGFLCQFTFDAMPEGRVPRLLVFDVLCPATTIEQRGEVLRSMQGCLPQPLCCVQWSGYTRYISPEFVEKLPHVAAGIMVFGPDPLKIYAKKI
jgi:hypothetical protein